MTSEIHREWSVIPQHLLDELELLTSEPNIHPVLIPDVQRIVNEIKQILVDTFDF